MNIRYTDRAVADLEAIADYLVQRSPQGARKVKVAIERAVEQLERFPGLGTRQTTEGVRKLVVSKYPYLVFYVADISADEVRILTVQHSARQREFKDA
jgi:addiction module RelE/StbE family toxin